MRRSISIWLQLYLAACLILSGVAGLSPVFHRLLDHGGRGYSHTHWPGSAGHTHAGPHWHAHDSEAPSGIAIPRTENRRWLFVHKRQMPGPSEAWEWICHHLDGWFHVPSSVPAQDQKDPGGHEHRGLSTLLLNGLADATVPNVAVPVQMEFLIEPPGADLLSVDCRWWPASLPTRGPPAAKDVPCEEC